MLCRQNTAYPLAKSPVAIIKKMHYIATEPRRQTEAQRTPRALGVLWEVGSGKSSQL
jgi:hypothetical protein